MDSSSLIPSRTPIQQLGTACVVLGAASIVGSVATWAAAPDALPGALPAALPPA